MSNEHTECFLKLLRTLGDSIVAQSRTPTDRRADAEHAAVMKEQESLVDELLRNPIVVSARETSLRYYEGLRDLRLDHEEVHICMKEAIYDFAQMCMNNSIDRNTIQDHFCRHARRFLYSMSANSHVCKDICHAPSLMLEEKKSRLLSVVNTLAPASPITDSVARRIAAAIRGAEVVSHENGHESQSCLQLQYFRPFAHVLRMDCADVPEWFRKTGPIGADFAGGTVCARPKILEALTTLISENWVSVLEGDAGTGKTTLIRMLAHTMLSSRGVNMYYFSCAEQPDFDIARLCHDIRENSGIFVIEDVQLSLRRLQVLYGHLYPTCRQDRRRHILFVTRPSFRHAQCSRLDPLDKIASLVVDTCEVAKELVKQYVDYWRLRGAELVLSPQAIEEIAHISGTSLWLLAYALEGCRKEHGAGLPRDWIRTGVRADLTDLANCGDPHAGRYPEILVVLSCLFKNEVATAQEYLVRDLGIPVSALEALTNRGEVTYVETGEGGGFYGLPHSALADAYWQHGTPYRVIPARYVDCLYDYVMSGASNGLEAVMRSRDQDCLYASMLIDRLASEDKLADVIKREKSFSALYDFVDHVWPEYLTREPILRAIVEKIENAEEPFIWLSLVDAILMCTYGRESIGVHWQDSMKIWQFFDKRKLAMILSRPDVPSASVLSLHDLVFSNPDLARQVVGFMECEELAARLNLECVGSKAMDWVREIHKCSPGTAIELRRMLDKGRLALALSASEDPGSAYHQPAREPDGE
jgi:hypothetical protein